MRGNWDKPMNLLASMIWDYFVTKDSYRGPHSDAPEGADCEKCGADASKYSVLELMQTRKGLKHICDDLAECINKSLGEQEKEDNR